MNISISVVLFSFFHNEKYIFICIIELPSKFVPNTSENATLPKKCFIFDKVMSVVFQVAMTLPDIQYSCSSGSVPNHFTAV